MVYLHVPFCRSFCAYCSFYSEIAPCGRDGQLFEAYADAVCAEIARRREEIEATRGLNTLYIGGGTPSVLPLTLLRKIVATLGSPQPLRSDTSGTACAFTEFTVEVNPDDIVRKGSDYVRGLLALGVNRISMGVQSLDDEILHWMGRRHDAAGAREAVRILRDAGVDNLSLDLIFGLSQLSEETLSRTLDELLAWRPEHLSAYQLSVEEGSALDTLVQTGRYREATQEQCAAQYRLICDRLRDAGYKHYEISNWALPGREAVHNSAYWDRHPYVGLGPGAHSFRGRTRSWNPDKLKEWLRQDAPAALCEMLSPVEIREEEIMLGLRTARGIPAERLADGQAAPLLADGSLERAGKRLRIPESRWFVSDGIIARLF